MTLSDLANLGEFIGGIAVIVTLIYLAVQLKQNSKMARANAVATLLARYESPNAILAGSAEASRVFRLGTYSDGELNEDESTQYHCICIQFLAVVYAAYKFQCDGILSQEQWQIYRNDTAEFIGAPGFRKMMPYFKSYYAPDRSFIAELESMESDMSEHHELPFKKSIQEIERGSGGSPSPNNTKKTEA